MKLLQHPILLASQSPRRLQLMRELGFTNLTVRPTDSDETIPEGMPVQQVAAYLAEKKAAAGKNWLKNEEILLAADTIVVLNGVIFGKPTDFDDAKRIIQALSNQMHQVITGVCLLSKNKKIVFSDTANVYFDTLTNAEIEFYIHACKPFDKAGAYGIQEWIGHAKIKRIEGSYSTIMGLPTHLVFKHLSLFEHIWT
jgi:septum formation protein